jgi:hypothetical protein
MFLNIYWHEYNCTFSYFLTTSELSFAFCKCFNTQTAGLWKHRSGYGDLMTSFNNSSPKPVLCATKRNEERTSLLPILPVEVLYMSQEVKLATSAHYLQVSLIFNSCYHVTLDSTWIVAQWFKTGLSFQNSSSFIIQPSPTPSCITSICFITKHIHGIYFCIIIRSTIFALWVTHFYIYFHEQNFARIRFAISLKML